MCMEKEKVVAVVVEGGSKELVPEHNEINDCHLLMGNIVAVMKNLPQTKELVRKSSTC